MADSRERRLENLCKAIGENIKSKAVNRAADYYRKRARDTTAVLTSAVKELIQLVVERGNVMPAEITVIPDANELVNFGLGR
ncbi:hypothetical protein [Halorussus salinisoli]|uniref:hypothetical protein n=1 Tax=Halorussus salinisoli TaxID=2558242 RepID=UPI0010C18CF5|nr:hypothetical protein [Halorussus salinisoli]